MATRRHLMKGGFDEMLQGDSPAPRQKDTAHTFKRRSTNNIDVQRSLKLLDDAVAPAFPAQVLSRTPRSSMLRHSNYTPKKVSSASKFDITDIYTPSQGSMLVNVSEPSLHSTFQIPGEMEITQDVTTTNVSLLLNDDPGLTVSTGLYGDFDRCLQQNGSPHQVLDLLADYEACVSEQVTILRKLLRRARLEQQKFEKTYSMLDLLDKERSTWQLVRSLFKDRLETQATRDASLYQDMESEPSPEQRVLERSEEEIVNQLMQKDSSLRESQLVVDWLESCAQEDLQELADNVKFFNDQPVVWENSLHQLQNKKKGVVHAPDRPLVDQLDPDAPMRQARYLDDLDKEDEQRLLQHTFLCLRAGQLDKAQELCQSCGQAWRAGTLEGWRLYHDPNRSKHHPTLLPIAGNPYRAVWKNVCWNMAAQGGFEPFETAIYAVLSGNLSSVLPVCHSWYDWLWAYYRCLVDVRVEQEIRLRLQSYTQPADLPSQYWDALMEPAQVFEELQASTDKRIRTESQQNYHVIQKYIILGDLPGLVGVMYGWVQKERESLPPHLVRFMAHLVLFLRSVGQDSREELCTALLELYVEQVMQTGQGGMLARYVATLPPSHQVHCYARFLQGVKGSEERQSCLQQAELSGLDVAAITKQVVENICNQGDANASLNASLAINVAISEDDRQKIEAIDWLVFDPSQRAEALKQANAIMRSFIVVKKHNAARELFQKLPADSINLVYKTWHAKTGSTSLPACDANAVREYMCMKAYLDAMESYNDWFSLYHHNRPSEPITCEVGNSFTERVALEHRQKQFQLDMERWTLNLQRQTQTTKDRIYNVLLFMDGGWMVDQCQDPEEDEGRTQQMAALRRMHIPALSMNLLHMLSASQLPTQCLALAECIASERHKLYKEFSKEDLQQLLRQIQQASITLLDQNKDPLGYELV